MMKQDMKRVIERGAEVKPEYRGRGLEFFGDLEEGVQPDRYKGGQVAGEYTEGR